MTTQEIALRKPSEKLLSLIDECASAFGKLCDKMEAAKQQGLEEGYSASEIGSMIRRKMLKAGYSRMTVSRYLPAEFKAKPRGFQISNSNKMLLNNGQLAGAELTDNCKLILGDCVEASDQLPDNSIDLIFTDPPYDRESLPLYSELGDLAIRVLKPGCSLVTIAPEYCLPEIMDMLRESGLKYNGIGYMRHAGVTTCLWNNNTIMCGKHLLWFFKGDKLSVPTGRFVANFVDSNIPDKSSHEWAQSPVEAEHYISPLTLENQTVLDPFMGTGTFGIAAMKLNRQFIGIENNPERFAEAQKNLSAMLKQA